MNFPSMVHQAKLRNLQNRLGFVLQVSGADSPELNEAIRELERARLLEELLGPLGMVRSGAAGSIAVAAAQGSARRPSRQT